MLCQCHLMDNLQFLCKYDIIEYVRKDVNPMSDKKVSGVRTDLSPSEFKARMDKVAPKEQQRVKKIKNFFGNLIEILSSLGLFPVLKTSSSKGHRAGGHAGGEHHHSSGNNFKENYHVEAPRTPSYDEVVRREIAVHQYIRDTDGIPNDHQCGGHDR